MIVDALHPAHTARAEFEEAVGADVLEMLAEYRAILAEPAGEHRRTLAETAGLLAHYLEGRHARLLRDAVAADG